MPLRASLARSLQYAMANMADIKTPLCALQPTPAIPHTASRSGAGTRGGGGAGSNGRRPGARVPSTPGARRPRLAARGPRPRGAEAAGPAGVRAPGRRAHTPGRRSLSVRAHVLTLAPSRRRRLTGEGAGPVPAPRDSRKAAAEKRGAALRPGRRARAPVPPPGRREGRATLDRGRRVRSGARGVVGEASLSLRIRSLEQKYANEIRGKMLLQVNFRQRLFLCYETLDYNSSQASHPIAG